MSTSDSVGVTLNPNACFPVDKATFVDLDEQSAAATSATYTIRLYPKSHGRLYYKNDACT